jgi:hypothetical protein
VRKIALAGMVGLAASACTAVNTAIVPSDRSGKDIFVAAGDIPEPYDTLGLVQVSKQGVLLAGFFDPVGTDIQAGFTDALIPQIRQMGGDGAINARFRQTQYITASKVFAAIFFIFPLPTGVTLTAEVVKLRRGPGPAAAPVSTR